MDVVPAAVASGFLQPALLHFCDLLSSNTRGASIKSRSLGTLHKVGPEGRFRPEGHDCRCAAPRLQLASTGRLVSMPFMCGPSGLLQSAPGACGPFARRWWLDC